MPLMEIGKQFPILVHHATVLHSIKAIDNLMDVDKRMAHRINMLLQDAETIITSQITDEEEVILQIEVQCAKEEIRTLKSKQQEDRTQIQQLQSNNAQLREDLDTVYNEFEILSGEFRLIKKKVENAKYSTAYF